MKRPRKTTAPHSDHRTPPKHAKVHATIRAMIGFEPVRLGRGILWGLLWLCVL